ncbi:hypothetical protein G6L15_06715 [Agrobacterium rhizogenes]|uniref:hypothetical protein n=1 Tax=Rhizobium rhizogenes TaxID=359 RepID=UPI00157302F6|nr:hypothetical protein [Rhizobium rhizogenes]NTG85841.1 hypothetical protein [Rhizobium rhizogenes]
MDEYRELERVLVTEIPIQTSVSQWQWWAGDNEEWMSVGPCVSREEAIAAATDECVGEFKDDDGQWKLSIHVVEARQDPLRLADWIGADRLLEMADDQLCDSDRVSHEYEEGPWFAASTEQEADLAERIKRACDDWQAAHGLMFKSSTFTHTRNKDGVVVPHPNAEEAV